MIQCDWSSDVCSSDLHTLTHTIANTHTHTHTYIHTHTYRHTDTLQLLPYCTVTRYTHLHTHTHTPPPPSSGSQWSCRIAQLHQEIVGLFASLYISLLSSRSVSSSLLHSCHSQHHTPRQLCTYAHAHSHTNTHFFILNANVSTFTTHSPTHKDKIGSTPLCYRTQLRELIQFCLKAG